MTPELARAVMIWIRERQTRDVTIGPDKTTVTVRILPAARECPQVLLDYLFQSLGSEQFLLTSAGWGVPVHWVADIADQARTVLNQLDGVGAPEQPPASIATESPIAQAPPVEMKPPGLQKRRGFVLWKLCDPKEVKAQIHRVSDNHRERKRVLEALAARPVRYLPLTTLSHVRTVVGLRQDFPNFSSVIDVIADSLSLGARTKAPLKLPLTLLLGAPGLGKTAFAKELALRLGFELSVRSLAEMTAGFMLTGGSSSWSDSRPGLIATLLADMRSDLAPLLMLDELDKVRSASSHPPDVVLLGLFEGHTARAFREENLDLQLNIEPISYLLTGNRLDSVRPEILSRLQMAEIRMPTQAEMKDIVRSVDRVLRKESPGLAAAFGPLTDDIMASLSVVPPRNLRAMLNGAYARVARRDSQKGGRLVITRADLSVEQEPKEAASPPLPQERGYIVPLLVVDPAAWWRVH